MIAAPALKIGPTFSFGAGFRQLRWRHAALSIGMMKNAGRISFDAGSRPSGLYWRDCEAGGPMRDPMEPHQPKPSLLGRSCLMMLALLAGFVLLCIFGSYFWIQDTFSTR
jgi:hypothetical protein